MHIGRSNIDNNLFIIILCHEMKWTYSQYIEQPDWFVRSLHAKINIENYHANRQLKKSNRR